MQWIWLVLIAALVVANSKKSTTGRDLSLLAVSRYPAFRRWDGVETVLNEFFASDVVVDVLLGVHVTFEELRTDDQATVLEMIRWANRSSLVLSIDVPSGLSATSGLLTEVDGQTLVMSSKHVVSLGAPKTGLLHALALDAPTPPSLQVWVGDIGISTAAWSKHGSRRKHGVEFGSEWVVPLTFALGPQA